MSNGSKSVNDEWSGVVKKNRVKKRKENVHIESCIAFSHLDNQLVFLIIDSLDSRPLVASEVVVWKPYFYR